jgi:hypothetical protein
MQALVAPGLRESRAGRCGCSRGCRCPMPVNRPDQHLRRGAGGACNGAGNPSSSVHGASCFSGATFAGAEKTVGAITVKA